MLYCADRLQDPRLDGKATAATPDVQSTLCPKLGETLQTPNGHHLHVDGLVKEEISLGSQSLQPLRIGNWSLCALYKRQIPPAIRCKLVKAHVKEMPWGSRPAHTACDC